MKRHRIAIYSDQKSFASAGGLAHAFQKSLGEETEILSLTADELLNNNVLDETISAFVLPGIVGEHSLYHSHIGERGNDIIRSYVDRGGVFMGLCAGAYYAASVIEYKPEWAPHRGHTRGLLTLFNGTARGPIPGLGLAATEPGAYNGCTTVPVLLYNGARPHIAYSCGPAFYHPTDDAEIFARYDTNDAPVAAFSTRMGRGHVILSGILPQYGTPDGWQMPENPHPVDHLINRIQPFESGRRYLWNRMTNIIQNAPQI